MKIKSNRLVLLVAMVSLLSLNGMSESQAGSVSRTPCLDQFKMQIDLIIQGDTPAQKKLDIVSEKKALKSTTEAACLKIKSHNESKRPSLEKAINDAQLLANTISPLLSDYISLGTSSGSITLSKLTKKSGFDQGIVTFTKMTNATGVGLYSPDGPGVTGQVVKLSQGSHLSSGFYRSGSTNGQLIFCVVVTNNSTYSKYSNEGLIGNQIGGVPLTCTLNKP